MKTYADNVQQSRLRVRAAAARHTADGTANTRYSDRRPESGAQAALCHGDRNQPGVVQGVFVEALANMTAERFARLVKLPEYGLEAADQENVIAKFDEMRKEDMKFYSIGQCVAFAFQNVMGPPTVEKTPWGEKKKKSPVAPGKVKKLTEKVHAGLRKGGKIAKAEFKSAGKQLVTLYRGDTRSYAELVKAGGMWGRESGAVPASHARMLVADLMNLSETKQGDWVQNWKASTKSKTEIVPYVATGKESQKGGNTYRIDAPLEFQALPGEKLFIGTDTGNLETANVIAVKMRGGEVIFVTGIPIEFIAPPKKTR